MCIFIPSKQFSALQLAQLFYVLKFDNNKIKECHG